MTIRSPWFALVCLMGLVFYSANGHAVGPVSGERLVYNIHWMGAPGGKAEIRYLRQDENHYSIIMTLESIGLVDVLHSIRDRFEATGLLTPTGPVAANYLKLVRQGKKEKRVEMVFNRQENYAARLEGEEKKEEERFESLEEGTNDPLSAIYKVRMMEKLQGGEEINAPMVEGKRRYKTVVYVTDAEPLYGPLGWFKVWQFSPVLQPSKLFEEKGNMTFWLSQDDLRLPVRINSRIKVGSIIADLMAYDDGRGNYREFSQR
ncbi:MAG: DUF3108 domain-containing protein [Magnetococcales bacterium]|nr:DUF3108 domain-containing protein [Magnetococcales bacterium]NGZ26540.1 DUF3108 domain-containing protein [Magnetococcales bacterium]